MYLKDGLAGDEAVGGVGVVASRPDIAEFAAYTGASSAGLLPSLSSLPPPGMVLIDGITLPFVIQTTQPEGTSPGSGNGTYSIGPMSSLGPVPERDLITERAGPIGGLSLSEVQSIVNNAIATANMTRAAIR